MNYRMDTLYGVKVSPPSDVVKISANYEVPPLSIAGIRIVESEFAVRIAFEVTRWPGKKKRRKGWFVKRVERPCAFLTADGIGYMHPSLTPALRASMARLDL